MLGNAIKFTEQGEVVVNIEVDQEETDRVELHISFRDTGIGIPAAQHRRIFEAFSQADSSTTREYGGTGLGLSITSHLVQMLNGRIDLESEEGKGSTFHVYLPFEKQRKESQTEEKFDQLRGKQVLIVDDNETHRAIVEEILHQWGMKPEGLETGREAEARLQDEFGRENPLHLLIIDASMPEMDGFEVINRLKKLGKLPFSVIMMLSSAYIQDDISRCKDLEIDHYIKKPISQSSLFSARRLTFLP